MDKYDIDPEHCEVSDSKMDQNQKDGPAGSYVPGTDEEKALVRKIDMFILPTMWIMYLLSYMDRTKLVHSNEVDEVLEVSVLTPSTSIGNAKIAGMADDLELDSQRYSIALVVFFVGYVVFEVPSK